MKKKALLIIDVQNDFCPGGALPVKDGDMVVEVLNQYISYFKNNNYPIFASRDWHPRDTKHFKDGGGPWPAHCVQETKGAEFHPKLKLPENVIIISKGMDPGSHGYSAFEALNNEKKDLLTILKFMEIDELYIGGLATDYCVKNTVMDAVNHFDVYLLMDAMRGVNINPNDSEEALRKMLSVGAKKITFEEYRARV